MKYRRFWLTVLPVVLVAWVQSGCAIVSSARLNEGSSGKENVGIPYMLPKAVVPYQVVTSGAQIRVDLLEPVFVGDPTQVYALSYQGSPTSNDTIKIGVDPATSLLKTLSLESTDETGEILKKAIATLRTESAAGSGETVIAQGILDPSDKASVEAARGVVADSITAYIAVKKAVCDKTPATDGCTELSSLGGGSTVTLSVTLMGSPVTGTTAFGSTAAAAAIGVDCSVGICIRGTVPYEVSLSALGQRRATLVQLPNHGPVTALPLSRHAFVKTTHTVALRNGMLESYDVVKPSSALAIVSWPLAVYDEIVTTTAKIIQLKIDTSSNNVRLQEQLFAEAEKRKELDDKLKDLLTRQESATLIGMGKSKTLLTLGTGTPPPILPSVVRAGTADAKQPGSGSAQTPGTGANPAPVTVPTIPGSSGTLGK